MGRATSRRLGDSVTSCLFLGTAGDIGRAPRDDTRRGDVTPSNPRATTAASRVEGVVGPVGTIASRKARLDASVGRGVGADIGREGLMYLFCGLWWRDGVWRKNKDGRVKWVRGLEYLIDKAKCILRIRQANSAILWGPFLLSIVRSTSVVPAPFSTKW